MPHRQDEMKALAEKVLRLTRVDDAAVTLTANQHCQTRFANNSVTTAGFTDNLSLSVRVSKDKKPGQVSLPETSDAALARAVRQAEAIAELSLPDPEYVEPLAPQSYPEINAFYEESARARTADILPAVRAVIERADRNKVNSFGYYSISTRQDAIANKRGLFGFHPATWAGYVVTARTPDGTGSGWAQQASPRTSLVDGEQVGETAIRKAVESQQPRKLAPGKYTVILEPAALGRLLGFLSRNLSARQADEGRSFLSKRSGGNLLGEKVFGENITLRSDPSNAHVRTLPWGPSWLPAEKTLWAEKGILKALSYDRYWARKSDQKPRAGPSNLILEGGTSTLDDLIASTDRGLLVTRFWYIRYLQPQTVHLTGLTRDGICYIEKGKIQYPVMNFRFNESVINLLNNVEAMTPAVPVGNPYQPTPLNGNHILPAVKVREFNFSSLSDAV